MNYLIGIALLLLFVSGDSFIVPSIAKDVEKYNPTDMQKRQEVLNLNKDRLEFAEKEHIANMHDVTWDNTLESKIKTMTCDERTSPGPDYVVFVHLRYAPPPMDRMTNPRSHPLQTKIACATLATKCEDERAICLMGPKNTEPEPSDFKNGSPGTQCSSLNGVSGLCVGGGVDVKPKEGGEAVSSASMPMALLSLVLGLIMA